ncbi:hypothetical protein MRBLMR1_004858 [Neorhizobium sp. LMR1-1-1.1]
MKKSIEELLNWAFTQELPKVGVEEALGQGFSSAWSMMSEAAILGQIVDRSPNCYGVVPDFVMTTAPHHDALVVGEAVQELAARGNFDIPAGWNPFLDWAGEFDEIGQALLAAEADIAADLFRAVSSQGRYVVTLVTRHAVLGRGPNFTGEMPVVTTQMRRGKPAWFVKQKRKDSLNRVYEFEADGYDRKKGRPMPGAYRKFEMDRVVTGVAQARLDWQLWQDALFSLSEALPAQLKRFELQPFRPDRQPWVRQRKMHADLQAFENVS